MDIIKFVQNIFQTRNDTLVVVELWEPKIFMYDICITKSLLSLVDLYGATVLQSMTTLNDKLTYMGICEDNVVRLCPTIPPVTLSCVTL